MFASQFRVTNLDFIGRLLVVILVAWLAAPSISAQQREGVSLGGSPRQEFTDTRITLNVKNHPLSEVIDYIKKRARVNIILAKDVDISTQVTVEFDKIAFEEAIRIVGEDAQCVVVKRAANLFILEQPVRISWKFESAPITAVIEAIGKLSGASIVASGDVTGNVNLTLNDVPWRVALDTAAKSLGYVVVEEDWGVLQIVHPSKLREQLESRMFQLKYVRPPAVYRPKIDTEYAVGKPTAPNQDPEQSFSLLKALRSTLSENGSLEYVSEHNVVIVKDVAPVIDQIGRLISEIDQEPAQVFVDVKFVTTTNTDALSYGVDIGSDGFAAGLTGSAIASRLPFSVGSEGFGVLPSANGAQGGSNGIPGFNDGDLAATTTFGRLDFTQASFTLKLLEQDAHSRIFQAPKLIALDNQEATIFVGRTIRFAQTEAEQGQAGGLTFSIKEAANSPVQTGFQLFLVPHVVPGTNKIMMTVIPEAEQLVGTSTNPNVPVGFDEFVSGEGTANEVRIALPQVASSTLVTTMMLESGETAVIGGLITESETSRVNKLPILGDIPILNFFFRHEERTRTRESLIIFITPRIIRDSTAVEQLIREEDLRRRKLIESEVERIFGENEGIEPAMDTN
ncbi:MAG: secretin N-terminal domain-containing protein [Planctomycetota bacterium]